MECYIPVAGAFRVRTAIFLTTVSANSFLCTGSILRWRWHSASYATLRSNLCPLNSSPTLPKQRYKRKRIREPAVPFDVPHAFRLCGLTCTVAGSCTRYLGALGTRMALSGSASKHDCSPDWRKQKSYEGFPNVCYPFSAATALSLVYCVP